MDQKSGMSAKAFACVNSWMLSYIYNIKHDAVSIAHALIDRIFSIFGPPKSLIVDEDRALSCKVMHYVLDALKIDIKCISPYNHSSLKTERYIQTINNLITRHLKDKGKEWPLLLLVVLL